MTTQTLKQIFDTALEMSKVSCEMEEDTYGKVSTETKTCRKMFSFLSHAIEIVLEGNGDGSVAI